jgi:hypothetical protein
MPGDPLLLVPMVVVVVTVVGNSTNDAHHLPIANELVIYSQIRGFGMQLVFSLVYFYFLSSQRLFRKCTFGVFLR